MPLRGSSSGMISEPRKSKGGWPGWRFGEGCCRRLRGSTLSLKFSMGLRPRLSAVAASAAYWNPRLALRGDHTPSNCRPCVVSCFQGQRSWVGWCFGARCCRRLRGSTLTLNFSMGLRPRLSAVAASAAYWNPRAGASGDHPPSNCRPCVVSCFQGQRSWVGWRFGARCCRRLRGSTLSLKFSMGLRPRLSAGAAFAAYWKPRAGASGIIHQVIVAPAWCPVFRDSAAGWAGASGRGAVAAFAARLYR